MRSLAASEIASRSRLSAGRNARPAAWRVWFSQMVRLRAVRRRARTAVCRVQARTWSLRMAGAVPPAQTIPIAVEPLDHRRSPFSGLTRLTWRRIAQGLLENVLQYTHGMTEALQLPPSPAAGYPYMGLDGRSRRTQEAYLETYARTLLLASCLLADEPRLRLHGRYVADYYREYLVRGTNPADPAYFGRAPDARFNQRTVEAALITVALRQAPEAMWDSLDSGERSRVLDWLESFQDAYVHDTNWRWFAVLTNTFLKLNGRPARLDRIEEHLRRLLTMHADAGWFRDGRTFDYYSAWAMQTFPILWAEWDGDAHADLRDEFYSVNDQFLKTFPHVFSRGGSMPAWGRSQCYRFAASAPLSVAFRRHDRPAIDPGFARRLASGNLLQFIAHPGVIDHGLLTLGFYGENASVIDRYSCVASPYWSSLAFLSLSLSAESEYWTAVENEGFWADPPEEVRFGNTGLSVKHDRESGGTRLYAPQPVRTSDRRYTRPYFEAP